ncbi:helix-turn-helix domain-containing protein [Amycolatopsis sp. NPDC026612]|uniref:helix-turn-helix domain-containing protein n=1 Tax=Amycolatopsis sp. NPDC026612 TaxID=3155466 RepID=UPI0033C1C899
MSGPVTPHSRRASEEPRETPHFGELLRWHRMRRGATQRQLADLSTVSVRAIRDLELGKARPRRDTVHLIADGLGLTGQERTHFEKAAGGAGQELKLSYDAGPVPPPAPMDTLVGREAEVSMLGDLLGAGNLRLVTVTGLPGVGKSRIALEIAGVLHREHRLPVLWSSASDQSAATRDTGSDPVSALVALALGRPAVAAAGTALAELRGLVGDRLTLLVMDGYEQADVDADALSGLLRHCGRLRVLITARTPFQLPGEREFPLEPLAVPHRRADRDPAELAQVGSVQLLTRCIGRTGFQLTAVNSPAVAELCRRLDGIPAPLQVAASWFMVCSPETLLQYLRDDPFAFVGPELGDAGRSELSALADDERALLDRLCAVEGCWSIADAVGLGSLAPAACARLVRRLLMRGVVRTSTEPGSGGFAVLELVKLLHAGRPAGVSYLRDEATV